MEIFISWISNDYSLLGIKHEYVTIENPQTGEVKEQLLLEVGIAILTVSIFINLREE